MPNNPTTASPVTRTQEVEAAIEFFFSQLTNIHNEGTKHRYGHGKTLLAYIAQLEASQPKIAPDMVCVSKIYYENLVERVNEAEAPLPKPQSDEGLREALELILPMAKGYAASHQVGNNQAFIETAEAALSRQAPAPTQRPVNWSNPPEPVSNPDEKWCDEYANWYDWNRTAPLESSALSQAPVPTSGAVEVAREIGVTCVTHESYNEANPYSPCKVVFHESKAAAFIQQAIDAETERCGEVVRACWGKDAPSLTQPPAADGKLREALAEIAQEPKHSVLLEAAYSGAGMGKKYLNDRKHYSDGWNACLDKFKSIADFALAQPASGGEDKLKGSLNG